MKKTLYFLGPKGTYSEAAAKKIKDFFNFDIEMKEISTIAKIVQTANENPNVLGIVPVENSTEGIVRQSVDSLYNSNVKIQVQINLKIEHCLVSKNKNKNGIKHIISHPQALAQSSQFILNNFDENIDLIPSNSTAAAARMLLEKDETYAAITSEVLCDELKLNILGKNIGDNKENITRFALISSDKIKLNQKDARTSIVFNTKNEPGALFGILNIFKKYNLNLVYLESRPSKKVFGEYNFFADIDRGIDEIIPAINEIKKECNFYKLLGSYPLIS